MPFYGGFVDLKTVFLSQKLFGLLGSCSFGSKFDFRYTYAFNSKIRSFDETDMCLLVGLNLRLQSPLLNVRLRRNYLANNIQVFVIGFCSNFSYYIKHLGCSISVFLSFLEGLH